MTDHGYPEMYLESNTSRSFVATLFIPQAYNQSLSSDYRHLAAGVTKVHRFRYHAASVLSRGISILTTF